MLPIIVSAVSRDIPEEPLTAASCLLNAQQMAIEYVREHPAWQLSGWRCERDKPPERPA